MRGWLQKTGDGGNATAFVNPADVAAMRAAVGDAMIAVEADPDLARRCPRSRRDDRYDARLAGAIDELRHTIATAVGCE